MEMCETINHLLCGWWAGAYKMCIRDRWNTYAFFVLYANIDNFDASKYTLEYDKLPVMDKWLLYKLTMSLIHI